MANFPVDPRPFLPEEMEVEDGGPDRRVRGRVHLADDPIRLHEEFMVAEEVDGILDPADYGMFTHTIRHYIRDELGLRVVRAGIHPFGVGLFELGLLYQRDRLLTGNIHNIDGFQIRFVKHDRAKNFREVEYERKGWILMLGFPLDYMTSAHVNQVVASFGKIIRWHNSPNIKSFVLVKCMHNSAADVPRSIIFTRGEDHFGHGCSWSVPTFVLNTDLDWPHGDWIMDRPEDPLPENGNPHPLPEEEALQQEGENMEAFVNQNIHMFQANPDPAWEAALQQNNAHNGWPLPAVPQQELALDQDGDQVMVQVSSDSSLGSTLVTEQGSSSQERVPEDNHNGELALLNHSQPGVAPDWVQPFYSKALQNLLNSSLPHFRGQAWWNGPPINANLLISIALGKNQSGPSFIAQLNSIVINQEAAVQRQFLEASSGLEGPPSLSSSVLALHAANRDKYEELKSKQVIKHVYFRKKKKGKALGNLKAMQSILSRKKSSKKRVTFGPNSVKEFMVASPESSRKATTPTSVKNLRRSSRIGDLHKGKHPRLIKQKKATNDEGSSALVPMQNVSSPPHEQGHNPFTGPVKFPTLADLDKVKDYLEIHAGELQRVAVERCSIPLEEASLELLLVANGVDNASSGMAQAEQVINE
jgi:hypothetical protein